VADLLVADARIVLPDEIVEGTLVVEGGKVVEIARHSTPKATSVVDAAGRYVLPGVIDPHTHPGLVAPAETRLPLEAQWMASGGVTTTISYFRRPESYRSLVPDRIALSERTLMQDFTFHLVLYNEEQVAEVARCVEELKVTSFKVYTNVRGPLGQEIRMDALPGQQTIETCKVDFDEHHLYSAFRALARVAAPVRLNVHCEDSDIVIAETSRVRQAERRGLQAWNEARPPEAEAVAIQVAGEMSRHFEVPLYIPHVGSRTGIEAIQNLQQLDTAVVAETCPHYLVLTESTAGEEAKVAPPIRTDVDRASVLDAVRRGVLTTLGSDDIPYTRQEKRLEKFWSQNSAFPGSGLLLPVALTAGLDLQLVARITSWNVAHAFGIEATKGSLLPGSDADFVIVDVESRRQVRSADLFGSSDFSVYEGMEMTGWPVITCARGRVIFDNGRFPTAGGGRFLPRGFEHESH
jgi:dihydropyrimidinase